MVTNFANVPSILADLDNVLHMSGGGIFAHAYSKYATNRRIMSPREQHNRLNISSGTDELTAQALSTATSISVVGSSANNFLKYVPNVTYIQFGDGDKRLVTGINAAGTTLTVLPDFAGSTSATQASGAVFKVGYTNQTGVNLLGRDDTQYSSTDYQYASNFQLEVPLDYLNAQGRYPRFLDRNEASFESQEELLEYAVIKQIEWEFWNGIRYTQGDTAASVGLLGTNAPKGGLNFTGGFFQFVDLHGGLTDNLNGAPITEARLRAQVRRLRLRNAFDDMKSMKESHSAQGYLVTSFEQGTMINQIVDNLRLRTEGVVKEHGTDIEILNIEGVRIGISRSIGMPSNRYALYGNRSRFRIDKQRFMEANKETYSGDRIVRPYENTWMNVFGNCFACLKAINCGLPDDIVES